METEGGKWNWKSKMTTGWEALWEWARARVDWVPSLRREIIQDIDRTESPVCDQLNTHSTRRRLCMYTSMCVLSAHSFNGLHSDIDWRSQSLLVHVWIPPERACFCVCTYTCECHWACTFVSSSSSTEAVNLDIPGHKRGVYRELQAKSNNFPWTRTWTCQTNMKISRTAISDAQTISLKIKHCFSHTQTQHKHTQSANKHSCIYKLIDTNLQLSCISEVTDTEANWPLLWILMVVNNWNLSMREG